MQLRKAAPSTNYSKICNQLWTDPRLSNGAVRVYGLYASFRTGGDYTDAYITKVLSMSKRTLTRCRCELRAVGLIEIDQISPRIYILYLGYYGNNAISVKEHWTRDINQQN